VNGFLEIEKIEVVLSAVHSAHGFLQKAGLCGSEGFALWVGRRNGSFFHVSEAVIPAQTGHVTDSGICVSVGAEELHRLNVSLYTRKLSIIAQLHSHPEEAYHSTTDDAFPIATTAGSLSLVIPDFARQPFSLPRCAIYRLTEDGIWDFLPSTQAEQLITFV
jgi:hypothetical protein